MAKPATSCTIGNYTLNRKKRLLTSPGNHSVALRKKTYDVLTLLIDRTNEVVAKDEIMRSVWKDSVVTDDSLVQCIAELRRKLNDSEKKIIKTVPKLGYILCADQSGDRTPRFNKNTLITVSVVLGATSVFLMAVVTQNGGSSSTAAESHTTNSTPHDSAMGFSKLHSGYFADNELVHKRLKHSVNEQATNTRLATPIDKNAALTTSEFWSVISNRNYGFDGTKFWRNGNIWSGYDEEAAETLSEPYSIIQQGSKSDSFQK